jgi:hypothetical protein
MGPEIGRMREILGRKSARNDPDRANHPTFRFSSGKDYTVGVFRGFPRADSYSIKNEAVASRAFLS